MSEQTTHGMDAGSQFVPLDRISYGENTRTKSGLDKESLNQLAESIKARGVIQPVVLRETADGYEVIAGHRRCLASALAGLSTVPALVTKADDDDALEIQIVENIQRENLSLMETAQAVRKMLAIHGRPATVAEKLNKSKAWVSKHLSVTAPTFPALVFDLLESGKCEDLETLLMLSQIAKHSEGAALFLRLKDDVEAGRAGRTKVRDALDALKNASPNVDGDQNGDEGPDTEGPATVTFTLNAKLARHFEALGGAQWLRRHLRKLEKVNA